MILNHWKVDHDRPSLRRIYHIANCRIGTNGCRRLNPKSTKPNIAWTRRSFETVNVWTPKMVHVSHHRYIPGIELKWLTHTQTSRYSRYSCDRNSNGLISDQWINWSAGENKCYVGHLRHRTAFVFHCLSLNEREKYSFCQFYDWIFVFNFSVGHVLFLSLFVFRHFSTRRLVSLACAAAAAVRPVVAGDDAHFWISWEFDEHLAFYNGFYDQPWGRLSPYLFGICMGYILHKTEEKFDINIVIITCGRWHISIYYIIHSMNVVL